ncbi:MAG: hypothetical protein ACLT07_09665 [Clostridia bacterium]
MSEIEQLITRLKRLEQGSGANRFRGRYVDMVDISDDFAPDEWALALSGTKRFILIGTKAQIMDEYDEIEKTGVIKDYKDLYPRKEMER